MVIIQPYNNVQHLNLINGSNTLSHDISLEGDWANITIFAVEKTEAQADKATCQHHGAMKRWGGH